MAGFTDLLRELGRRNVFKVGVVYAIVAWILIQVASTAFPALRLPDWTTTFVTVLILIGFPVALLLAWAYELTPEGLKRTHDVDAAAPTTKPIGRKIDFTIIALLAITLLYVVLENYVWVEDEPLPVVATTTESKTQMVGTTAAIDRKSVAVLPLDNLSPDPDNAYFAAGMHDEILNRLAKLRHLMVISRTSVLRYGANRPSIPEIARELNVQAVMEGSVRYDGERVIVQAQLIDAVTDSHLWTERYERDLADVFAIQADIAMNIAKALDTELSPAEQASIEARPTDNPEAYAKYLMASTPSLGLCEPHRYLDQALALDPDFALAHARKAYLSAVALDYCMERDRELSVQRAELEDLVRQHAKRALALDPDLGRAHLALGLVHLLNWRGGEARHAFERALQLSPNDPEVLFIYSTLNIITDQYPEAIRKATVAINLDPNNPGYHALLGTALWYSGNLDEAAIPFRKAIELDARYSVSRFTLGTIEALRGNNAAALESLRIGESLLEDEALLGEETDSPILAHLALAYKLLGLAEDASRVFAQFVENAHVKRTGPGTWALAYIAIGDYERALQSINTAIENRDRGQPDQGFFPLMDIRVNLYRDPVLEQPEFVEVRGKLGITE